MASYTASALNTNSMHYSDNTSYGSGWHGYPGMYASGSITFTRSSEQSSTVSFSGTIGTTMSSTGKSYYGYPITYKMYVGSSVVSSGTIYDYSKNTTSYATHTIDISGSFTLSNNTTDVNVIYYCNYNSVEGGCDTGTPSVTTFSLPAGTLTYNPHTAPTSYSITSVSPTIGTQGETTFTMTYTITGGTHDISATYARITDTSGTTKQDINISKTSKGTGLTRYIYIKFEFI